MIIHSKEWRKTTNTGHFARLAIQNTQVRLQGSPKYRLSFESATPTTLVLYPGRGATPLSAEYVATLPRPLTLLVPDGNWNQAQHMMRRLPLLQQAKPVCLQESNLTAPCLRRNHLEGRMSTFEAVAQALGILEGEEVRDRLLEFFGHALDHMTHNTRRGRRRSSVLK
jgi:DTW domain-containing protein YfiP